MPTISYETDEGIFHFHQKDVIQALESLETDDARKLTDFLESQVGDPAEIPRDNRIFHYIVLMLLNQGKATVFCRACGKQYHSGELQSLTLGAGQSPLKVDVRCKESLLRRIFGKSKRLPLFGGQGYRCPEGHEVISLVTWRT